MTINRIAFVGATGMLGRPVARQLALAGYEVTALVRDPNKASLPHGVRGVKGDVRDPESLTEFLSGMEALYVNLSVRPGEKESDFHTETDGLINLIGAARQAKIRRLALVSSLVMRYQGMNHFWWWAFDVKKKAVDLIRGSGIPYFIFYPSTFMENFEGNYRRGNRILLAGKSLHKMYFIAADDFGKQVATSFAFDPDGNREYVVQGPEGLTGDEAAEVYVKHYTKSKLRISRAPIGLLKFLGRFDRTMNYGAHIIEALNRYPEKFEAEKTWEELGTPEITLKSYAENRSL